MRVAQGTFGPSDVTPLGEVVKALNWLPDGEAIWVDDVGELLPETLAVVSSDARPGEKIESELGFRYLISCEDARALVAQFDVSVQQDEDLQEIIGLLEEHGS